MSEIPENVTAFLREHIDSVEQLEMLLLLRDNSQKEWSAEEVSRALSTQADSAALRLAEFHSRNLLTMRPAKGGPVYQYVPNTPLDPTVRDLAEAYSKYPVRIINLIYSKPIDKIRTFADAFKFRKEDQ